MNSWDHLNKDIERYKRELMGYTSLSAQVDAMRKVTSEMSASSLASAFTNSQSGILKEYERLQRATAPFDSIAQYTADIHKLTGQVAAQEAARHWEEISGLATVASSINASLSDFASKIAEESSAGRDYMGHRLGLTASHALAASILGNSHLTGLRADGIAEVQKSLGIGMSSLSEGLQASFSMAGLAGTASLEKAIAAVSGTISSEYAGQFDVERRIREMVGGMSTFDLARTMAIAQIQGVEGIAKQMMPFGLEPGEYLEDDDSQTQLATVGARSHSDHSPISLEVFQQLLINLIASYIFALFINPAIPNPDVEAQTKKLAQLESLIEKLPQAIEAQVEAIIRRQLLTVDSFFVVRERVARLRTAPESGSSVLSLVFPNQKLKVLEERGKWIRVEFYDYLEETTREGWVLKKYCTRLVQHVDQKQRERILNDAVAQTHSDMAAGRVVQESAEAHLARLDAMNAAP